MGISDALTVLFVRAQTAFVLKEQPQAAPFHADCTIVGPFGPKVVKLINGAIGVIDVVAIVMFLFFLAVWMFSDSNNSRALKRMGFILLGLLLINGILWKWFSAFGINQGIACLR